MEWFRDVAAWRWIAMRYLPWLAILNLVWEMAQLPLYTIWYEAPPAAIAFAVAHCTLGDVLIGAASLLLALVVSGAAGFANWPWWRIVVVMLLLGPGYTMLSEWLNTSLGRWTYSELMPALELPGWRIGLAPLLQWLTLPPLALHLAKAAGR